jgi:transcription-repair coupling factor (superfamily II helicase)
VLKIHSSLFIGSIHEGFLDTKSKIEILTDHQIFQRYHQYSLKSGYTRDQAVTLRMLKELQPGDYVTHIDHGVGKFSGLETIEIGGVKQESVRIIYRNNDMLYVSINSLHKLSKYMGKEGEPPMINKLGSDTWKNLKQKTKSKVKDIAKGLINLYAKRRASEGYCLFS